MEDWFSQGRLWQRERERECAWAGVSVANYVAGAFILDRVSEALFRLWSRCCLSDISCFHTATSLFRFNLKTACPCTIRRKSISIRERQWRGGRGFIIVCSSDKHINHIHTGPAQKKPIYHTQRWSYLAHCWYNHQCMQINFNS